MHQVIIRTFSPGLPVFDFVFGQIVDGQFQPGDCTVLPAEILDCVEISNLLGTQAFVQTTHITSLVHKLLDAGADMTMFPNFAVFNLPEGYVSKEKEVKE